MLTQLNNCYYDDCYYCDSYCDYGCYIESYGYYGEDWDSGWDE